MISCPHNESGQAMCNIVTHPDSSQNKLCMTCGKKFYKQGVTRRSKISKVSSAIPLFIKGFNALAIYMTLNAIYFAFYPILRILVLDFLKKSKKKLPNLVNIFDEEIQAHLYDYQECWRKGKPNNWRTRLIIRLRSTWFLLKAVYFAQIIKKIELLFTPLRKPRI